MKMVVSLVTKNCSNMEGLLITGLYHLLILSDRGWQSKRGNKKAMGGEGEQVCRAGAGDIGGKGKLGILINMNILTKIHKIPHDGCFLP